MKRVIVDLKIPCTSLRNPEFANLLVAVNKAPKGYKPPSYEKARNFFAR